MSTWRNAAKKRCESAKYGPQAIANVFAAARTDLPRALELLERCVQEIHEIAKHMPTSDDRSRLLVLLDDLNAEEKLMTDAVLAKPCLRCEKVSFDCECGEEES